MHSFPSHAISFHFIHCFKMITTPLMIMTTIPFRQFGKRSAAPCWHWQWQGEIEYCKRCESRGHSLLFLGCSSVARAPLGLPPSRFWAGSVLGDSVLDKSLIFINNKCRPQPWVIRVELSVSNPSNIKKFKISNVDQIQFKKFAKPCSGKVCSIFLNVNAEGNGVCAFKEDTKDPYLVQWIYRAQQKWIVTPHCMTEDRQTKVS